jgi:AcrR family transcriptional regulator
MERGARRRLPSGSHGIPAEVVARNQRERLVAAIAEACAERGYAETSVTEVAKRAGVSTVTFYRLFADKRDCMLAAHRALLGRLLDEVDRACAEGNREEAAAAAERDREAKPRAAIRTALSLLAADAPSARLLSVEVLAVGPEGMRRHDAAVEAFLSRLRRAREPEQGLPASLGSAPSAVPSADWALVAGIFALIGRRVMAGEADRLPELEDELVATLSSRSRA